MPEDKRKKSLMKGPRTSPSGYPMMRSRVQPEDRPITYGVDANKRLEEAKRRKAMRDALNEEPNEEPTEGLEPEPENPPMPEGVDYTSAITDVEDRLREIKEPEADNFADQLAKVRADYKAAKEDLGRRQMLEGVLHGLIKMAAGYFGNKQDINLGDVELKGSDWERKRDRALQEYQQGVGEVESAQNRAERAKIRKEDRAARLKSDISRLKERQIEAKQRRSMDIWREQVRQNQANYREYLKQMAKKGEADNKLKSALKKEAQTRIKALQTSLKEVEKGNLDVASGYAVQGGVPDLIERSDTAWFNPFSSDKSEAKKIIMEQLKVEQGKYDIVTGKSKLSPEDEQALQWAKENPNDPKAKQILQTLGQ